MSLKQVHSEQPKEFKFSTENLKKVEEILKRYPDKNKKSAVMPLQKFGEDFIIMDSDGEDDYSKII